MSVSGYVLVGGASRRMGRDKALLGYTGKPLVLTVAAAVRDATGNVSLLGDPVRYGHLGLPVIPDLISGQGPMSGLHAALNDASTAQTDWVLLVACDLPNLDAAFLRRLIESADSTTKCVAAQSENGLEPLCAVYHRNTLGEVESALRESRLRMRDLLARLGATGIPAAERLVRNVNTVEDWRLHLIEKERLS